VAALAPRERLPAAPMRVRRVKQWRMELEAFELVLLRRPPDAPRYDEATLERIQDEHVAYHRTLREAGSVVTNGPVTEQADESFRGLTFYRTGSLEQARRLAEADPAVQAGRLAVEVVRWLCPAGTMIRHGTAVSQAR
jgi:uncharacterized protein YciI